MTAKSLIFAFLASASLLTLGSSLQSFAITEVKDNSISNYTIETSYNVKIGTELYRVQFMTCALKNEIIAPSLIVKSDQETQLIQYNKIIYPNTCKNFETAIKAKHSNTITAELRENPYA
jgi:hypothetical protein